MKPGRGIDAQKFGREGDDSLCWRGSDSGGFPRSVCPKTGRELPTPTYFRAFVLGLVPGNGSSPIKKNLLTQ